MKYMSYRISSFKEDFPSPSYSGKKFILQSEVVPTDKIDTPQKNTSTNKIEIIVKCDFYVIESWKARDPSLEKNENIRKVLFEYRRTHLEEKLQKGEIRGTFEYSLIANDIIKPCEYKPADIDIDFNKWYSIVIERPIGF